MYGAINREDVIVGRLNNAFNDAHILLILTQFHLKKYNEVVLTTKLAIEHNLKDKDFYYFYSGRVAYQYDKHPMAISYFKQVIDLNPEHLEAHQYCARSLKAIGDNRLASKMHAYSLQLQKRQEHVPKREEQIDVHIF